jgi:hypothetical protein
MRLLCVVICLALSLVAVNADSRFFGGPVIGSFNVLPLAGGGANHARISVEGSGFRLVAANTDSGAVDAFSACLPCKAGDEISLSALFANDDLGEGTMIVAEERLRQAYVAGYLAFDAGSVLVPAGDRLTLSLRTEFTLVDGAELRIYEDELARMTGDGDRLWANGLVSGGGIATINLTRVLTPGGAGYVVERIKYTFTAPSLEFAPNAAIGLIGNPASDVATAR